MSVNLELPTAEGLKKLAPHKSRTTILRPMKQIRNRREENRQELVLYRHAPEFVPAGQSAQMIVGAAGESDYQIVSVAEALYRQFSLKRVFYSAFVSVNEDKDLPVLPQGPLLLREHRLYQADWLLRFYGFRAEELLSEKHPNFNLFLDPNATGPSVIWNVFLWRSTGQITGRFSGFRNRREICQKDSGSKEISYAGFF